MRLNEIITKVTYDEIIAKVAADNNLPKDMTDRIYRSYWKAVKEHISALPLKDGLSDEEFEALRPNVNIPSLGKLCVTLDRYKALNHIFKQRKENQDATHQED